VDAWLVSSRHRRDWVLRLLHAQVLSGRDDAVIAVWGLAYKPATASTKNSPAVALIEGRDGVTVRGYDPQVVLPPRPGFCQVGQAIEACTDADGLAIMTPWPEFRGIDPSLIRETMRGRTIVDPFGVLDGAAYRRVGFDYFRLGEPAAKEVLV
jgi:UDPglucose 6-dehydrogenase